MKKVFSELWTGIVAAFTAIIFGIAVLFMLPFDYIKYKRSHYYKKERKKYEPYAGSGYYFNMNNAIAKNDLPIQYFENPHNNSFTCGWFVLNNILIVLPIFPFEYDPDSQTWSCFIKDDEQKNIIMTLDEYMETAIQDANELAGQVICSDAVILIDGDYIEPVDMAKKDKRFLICEGNYETVLKAFCESNNS